MTRSCSQLPRDRRHIRHAGRQVPPDGAVLENAISLLPVERGPGEVIGSAPGQLRLHLRRSEVVRAAGHPGLTHPHPVAPAVTAAVSTTEMQGDTGQALDVE